MERDNGSTAQATGLSPALRAQGKEDSYVDMMDRICITCYGEGKYCDACEASVLFCELYNHCTDDEKRHVTCDLCNGTGLKLDEPRGSSAGVGVDTPAPSSPNPSDALLKARQG